MKEFLIGAAGIVLAGAAIAQAPVAQTAPAPQMAPMPPMGMDRVQTRNEVVAKVREHFAQYRTQPRRLPLQVRGRCRPCGDEDRMGDKLGGKNWKSRRLEHRDPGAAFDRLDANKDGAISRDEFAKGHEMRTERRVELRNGMTAVPGTPDGDGHGMHMRHMGGGGMMGGHMFEMADANKDGRVSLQEATDAAVKHFDMADANHDGRITPDERRTMHREMIEKRAPKAG